MKCPHCNKEIGADDDEMKRPPGAPTAEEMLPQQALKIEELLGDDLGRIPAERLGRILQEFHAGFDFLRQFGKSASIFGSSRSRAKDADYQEAMKLAGKLAEDRFVVITGGGPGIMEGANRGAMEAGGTSVGLGIQLPTEQHINEYATHKMSFHYFFVRKVMLSFASEVYIFFPGGFGTLDEFFELVTLIQTGKARQIPVVLVDKEYWTPLLSWMDEVLYQDLGMISEEDTGIYYLVDSADEAFEWIHGQHQRWERYEAESRRAEYPDGVPEKADTNDNDDDDNDSDNDNDNNDNGVDNA